MILAICIEYFNYNTVLISASRGYKMFRVPYMDCNYPSL